VKVSAYAPFFNNRQTILPALKSLQDQTIAPTQIFGLDDGSTDQGSYLLEAAELPCLRQPYNQGRGAARHRAILESTGDLVVSCDATNVLPIDFVERLLPWFDDPKVAAVYGWIQDPYPKGVVSRWRSRHLFKAGLPLRINRNAPLITYGTLMRRSAVLEVGNFNPSLLHSEDSELGERLLAAGYEIIFDPSVPVFCNVQNSLSQVLERYWRWYAGVEEQISWKGYLRSIVFSIKEMAFRDLSFGDPMAASISLLCPHYQLWTTFFNRLSNRR
jgi:glycosyltransferase involved in cell wall biosynthesis